MLEPLIAGLALGLVAGFSPGPFVAFVVATSLQHGLRAGLKVALAPVAIETTVMLVTLVFLSQIPDDALRLVGVVGGAAIAALGVRTLWRAGRDGFTEQQTEGGLKQGTGDLFKMVGAGLLSPAPWVFWTAIAGPLLLRQWRQGPLQAVLFYVIFLAVFVGSQMLVALGASRGAPKLKQATRQWVMRGIAVIMVAAGGVLAWQSWTGNFQKLIQTQRKVQERLQ